jgi:hypothetical protein
MTNAQKRHMITQIRTDAERHMAIADELEAEANVIEENLPESCKNQADK